MRSKPNNRRIEISIRELGYLELAVLLGAPLPFEHPTLKEENRMRKEYEKHRRYIRPYDFPALF